MCDYQTIVGAQYYVMVLCMDFNGLQRTFTTVTISDFWHFYGHWHLAQCVSNIIVKAL